VTGATGGKLTATENQGVEGSFRMRLCQFAVGVLLFAGCMMPAAAEFEWDDEDGALRLSWEEKPVLQYNYETVSPPEGVDPVFERAAYVHPIWDPAGRVITDDFSDDHYHHRGLWFSYSKTEFGDLKPNFWEFQEGTGRIVFDEVESREADDEGATLTVLHRWEARSGDEWVPAVAERWELTVHAPTSADQDYWEIDLVSEQACASDTPVVITQLRSGGLGFRGHAEWTERKDDVVVLTSEGDDRSTANETRPRWCTMAGPLGDGFGGFTIMDHPENAYHPTPVRVHPAMPFFCAMPAQKEPHTIEPDAPLVVRHRILVHASRPEAEAIDGLWKQFAEE